MTDPDPERTLSVRINGVPQPWKADWSLTALLEELEATGPGVAVERNRIVVRRSDYPGCLLRPGDEIEIVRLVGGG